MTDTQAGDSDEQTGPPPAGLGEHPPFPAPRPGLGAGSAVVLALAAGVALWSALAGTGPAQLDGALLSESVEARSGGLTAVATTITTIGGTVAMAVLAIAVGAWCWYRGRRADAVLVVGTMAGAGLVFRGFKVLLHRPRPPAATQLVQETNESLPSGHATMSIAVIGTLVVLAWVGRGVTARMAIVAAAAGWVGAVGATRIYLGVHWFSDVLAGWLVGATWLALCVAAWSWWRARQPGALTGRGAP